MSPGVFSHKPSSYSCPSQHVLINSLVHHNSSLLHFNNIISLKICSMLVKCWDFHNKSLNLRPEFIFSLKSVEGRLTWLHFTVLLILFLVWPSWQLRKLKEQSVNWFRIAEMCPAHWHLLPPWCESFYLWVQSDAVQMWRTGVFSGLDQGENLRWKIELCMGGILELHWSVSLVTYHWSVNEGNAISQLIMQV